jgi:hypothetical protein
MRVRARSSRTQGSTPAAHPAARTRFVIMKWVSSDGQWRVDLVRLSLTGTGRDGEWLRVTEYGFYAGEVRARDDLACYLDPDDLRRVDAKCRSPRGCGVGEALGLRPQ